MPTPRQQRMTGQQLRALALKIAQQVQRNASKGVRAATIFLSARIKETLSVPAPRKRVRSKLGNISYRATVAAIPGAPPRKLSGKLRQSVTYTFTERVVNGVVVTTGVVGVKARGPSGFNYPKWLERNTKHPHKFMAPTVRRYRADLATIVGRPLRVGKP